MMFTLTPTRALKCPCGYTLVVVSDDAMGSLWRNCPECKAHVRFDLPSGRFTVEQPPRRRAS